MSENKETKVVKKTTTKKTTTPKTTKKEEVVEAKKEITLNDIPKELLDQLTSQLTQQILSTINTPQISERESKPVTINKQVKYTKAYLNSNEDIRKELIEVRSIYEGTVNFVSNRTKIAYKWLEKDSIEYLTVEELLAMESSSLRFLHTPWLVVEDERIIEAFNLKDLYSTINEVENLDMFLENDIDYIEEIINKLPREFKIELISDVANGIKNKTIKIDYLVLQKLKDLLDYDFME